MCLIQCVSHTAVKCCNALVSMYVQRSVKVTQTMQCMQRVGLQLAHYIQAAAYRTVSRYHDMKCHDILISLLGYDMITSWLMALCS